MEPEREKPGGFPPTTEQKPYFVHTAVLTGIAVFFCSTDFFLFSGSYPSSGKTNSRAHAPFGVCAFTLSVNAVFWYFPVGQAFHVAEGRRPSGLLLEIQTKRRYTAWTLAKKRIWVRGQLIEVTDEVYAAYMKGDRKMRYFEKDLKCERLIYGSNGEIKQVIPSREDSLDRLMEENARQFAANAESVEDVVFRKLTLDKLHTALLQLPKEERALIYALFFDGKTESEVAKHLGVSRQAIQKRKNRILKN